MDSREIDIFEWGHPLSKGGYILYIKGPLCVIHRGPYYVHYEGYIEPQRYEKIDFPQNCANMRNYTRNECRTSNNDDSTQNEVD